MIRRTYNDRREEREFLAKLASDRAKKSKKIERRIADGKPLEDNVLYRLDNVNKNVVKFWKVTEEMVELYSKKNADYGDSFAKSLDDDGLLVSKIRLNDKMGRFNSILDKGVVQVDDETVRDTLIDLANYAAMTIQWMDKKSDSEKAAEDILKNGFGGTE